MSSNTKTKKLQDSVMRSKDIQKKALVEFEDLERK